MPPGRRAHPGFGDLRPAAAASRSGSRRPEGLGCVASTRTAKRRSKALEEGDHRAHAALVVLSSFGRQ
jgi:hypothetical protein